MDHSKFVILGGGMVAGYAAKQMVALGLTPGDLTILSADTAIPYERPPLSKGYLAGKEDEASIRINPEDFYRQHGIDLRLKCEVSAVDAKNKHLTLKDGGGLGFDKLVVATGARPRRLDVPGGDLQNLFYLRSLDDSKAIRAAAVGVKHAVVVGGGFIGMEVSAVLAAKGIEVVMVLGEDRIWKKLFSPKMSTFFEEYYRARGVHVIKNATVAELSGDTSVNAVVLADGQMIHCDIAVAGIGAQPVTDVLANSGLDISDGITVNEYLETNQPGVLAAGDVANYQDVIFGKRRRVEHWDNAVAQGQYCARALMGEKTAFKHVPYFFSDIFDLSYEYWGDSSAADQVVHRGDFAAKSFSAWWLQNDQVVAAFTMNRPDEERQLAPKWIEAKQKVSSTNLEDESQPIANAAK